MDDTHALTEREIAALAPASPAMYRVGGNLGDSISLTLSDFAEDDRTTIQQLYAALQELLAMLQRQLSQPEAGVVVVRAFLEQQGWMQLIRRVQELGDATAAQAHHLLLGQVLHDLRGGALQGLAIQLQFVEMSLTQADDIVRMFFLTHDHLKIMRNAVRDIDPQGYEQDQAQKLHTVHQLIERQVGDLHCHIRSL